MPHSDPSPLDRAESAFLGGLLRDPKMLDEVLPPLRPAQFRQAAHQFVYAAILEVRCSNQPIDLVSVANALHAAGHIEDAGGYAYLAQLWDDCPHGGNVPYYASLIREGALLRDLSLAAHEILHLVEGQQGPAGSAEQCLSEAEKLIFGVSQALVEGASWTLREAILEACARIDARTAPTPSTQALSTGLGDLDEVLAGLHPGEFTVLAARPSVGKTALGLRLLRSIVDTGRAAFIASLEMSRAELAERLMAAEAGIPLHDLRHGRLAPAQAIALTDARDLLSPLPLHIDDVPSQSMLRISSSARRLKRREDLALVMIDYLQLIEPEDHRVPRHEQVAQISRRLKALARELKIPVVALAQLNREVESRAGQKPRLSDLRDSGHIEQDADCVILLHKDPESPELLELIIGKQRNGPVGEVVLRYDRPTGRFESFEVGNPW